MPIALERLEKLLEVAKEYEGLLRGLKSYAKRVQQSGLDKPNTIALLNMIQDTDINQENRENYITEREFYKARYKRNIYMKRLREKDRTLGISDVADVSTGTEDYNPEDDF